MTHRGHQGTRELLVGRRALAAPSPAAVRRVRRSAAVGQAVAADGRDGQTARKKELNAGSGSAPFLAHRQRRGPDTGESGPLRVPFGGNL